MTGVAQFVTTTHHGHAMYRLHPPIVGQRIDTTRVDLNDPATDDMVDFPMVDVMTTFVVVSYSSLADETAVIGATVEGDQLRGSTVFRDRRGYHSLTDALGWIDYTPSI